MTDADWLLCGGSMDSAAAHLPPDGDWYPATAEGLSAAICAALVGGDFYQIDPDAVPLELRSTVTVYPSPTDVTLEVLKRAARDADVAAARERIAAENPEWASRLAVLDRDGTP